MKKRTLAAVLASVMLLTSALSGCGNTPSSSTGGETSSTSGGTSSASQPSIS